MSAQFAEWSDAGPGDALPVGMRRAEIEDQRTINEIQVASTRAPTDLARLLENPDRALFVAEHEGAVVGWAATHYFPSRMASPARGTISPG